MPHPNHSSGGSHLITLAVFWNRSRKCQGTQYGKITDPKMSQPFFFAKSIGGLLALTPKDSKTFQVSDDRMALAVSMALPTLVFTETRRMPKWMDTGGKCGKWKHVETRWMMMDGGLKNHAKTRGRELQLPLLFRLCKTRHRCRKVGNWCRLSVLCVFVAFNPLQLKTIQLKYIVLQSVERPATNNPSIVLSIASIGLSSGL